MLQDAIALIIALVGTTDAGNVEAAATLPDRDECHVELHLQPYDCPERARWALLAISNRESPNGWSPARRWVGVHAGDAGHSPGLGQRMRERGVFASWCPAHWGSDGFSTVGPHGMIYAFNVKRLGVVGNCVPWWVFALPRVSARAALHRYLDLCEAEPVGRSWCPTTRAVVGTRRRWEDRAA